jgi:hypothetical protein
VLCFCFVVLRLVYPTLQVSLDFSFLIAPSVFSNVYVVKQICRISIAIKARNLCIDLIYKICIEEFEDTKGVIRIRISTKNRQYNGQKIKYKRTNNDLQNIHIKPKIKQHEPH